MDAHGGPGELSLTTQTVTFVDSGCSPVSKNGCINRKRAMANTNFFIFVLQILMEYAFSKQNKKLKKKYILLHSTFQIPDSTVLYSTVVCIDIYTLCSIIKQKCVEVQTADITKVSLNITIL